MENNLTTFLDALSWAGFFVDILRENGDEKFASNLRSSINVGGTSNELLGSMRNQLLILQENKIPEKYNVCEEVQNIINKINGSLGPPPKKLFYYDEK